MHRLNILSPYNKNNVNWLHTCASHHLFWHFCCIFCGLWLIFFSAICHIYMDMWVKVRGKTNNEIWVMSHISPNESTMWSDVSWVAACCGKLRFWIIMLMSCISSNMAPSKSRWVSSLCSCSNLKIQTMSLLKVNIRIFSKWFRQINGKLTREQWQICNDGESLSFILNS